MRYVLTSSQGSARRPVPVRMHVTCSETSCRITDVSGYLPEGVAQRTLARTGETTWSAPGRASQPGCGGGGDDGLASAELTLLTGSVRLVVQREGAELRSSKCVSVYASLDGTFTGPRG